MDIALAVEILLPAADFRRAKTYDDLVATWHDARPVPTLEALEAAWAAYEPPLTDAEKLAALNAKFKQLVPVEYQGAFAVLWATVRALVQAGEPDLAAAAIAAAEVPAELAPAQAEFLAMLGGES